MDKLFIILLVFVPVTVGANLVGVSPVIVFSLAALAIVPLAKFIGEATEERTVFTGPALGGFLSATFGNSTELVIGIFAIRAGLLEVLRRLFIFIRNLFSLC